MNKLAVAITLTLGADSTHAEVEAALANVRKLFGMTTESITPAAAAAAEGGGEDEGTPANGATVDKNGFPWDERIHATTKTLNKDGTWRYRKGLDDATKASVEAALRQTVNAGAAAAPAPSAPAAPPTAPSAPPAPAAAKSAYQDFVDYVTEGHASKGGRITDDWLKQVLSWKQIPDGSLVNLQHASPELIAEIKAYMIDALK